MSAVASGEQGAADAAGGTPTLPSPLAAVDDMRAAAKWMLAAAGAVGAVLISGGPLIAIGQVHGALHVFLALLGLILAVGGVAVAIWFTSDVLMPRLTTPSMMLKSEVPENQALPVSRWSIVAQASVRRRKDLDDLLDIINKEPAEFLGVAADSVAGLFQLQADLLEQRADTLAQIREVLTKQRESGQQAPQRLAHLRANVHRVDNNLLRVRQHVRYVLVLGHAWRIKAALQEARFATFAGAGLVVIGAALFFISTSSNGPTYVPVVTTTPTATPVPSTTR
jgi:hypothetical protein